MKKYCATLLVCLFCIGKLFAQLCTGSLGDPVVHITFGNSTTVQGPLKPGVTNMRYADNCPNDGNYTITGSSPACFNNTWHSFSSDHTGDAGGRVMLINASVDPNYFYVDTVRGLCGNTIYEFAAWAANVLRPTSCNGVGIRPNITFRIESIAGLLLKEINSEDIQPADVVTWKQSGTFFTTPANTTEVVLRISNNSKGGCGNDLMLDDITFRPCGSKITAYPENTTNSLITVCGDQQTDIKLVANYSAGFAEPSLQWQISSDSGKTWTDISGEQGLSYIRKPTAAGYYQYRVAIAEKTNLGAVNCRVASNVTTIYVLTPPATSVTFVNACEGARAGIQAAQGMGYSYQWSRPNGFSATSSRIDFSTVQYADSGLYKVVISVSTCNVENSFYMRVHPGIKAVVSNETSICEGSNTTLIASGGNQYLWSPATSLSDAIVANPLASPGDTTNYKVVITNSAGCVDSAFVKVNVWKKSYADAGPDQQISAGQQATLKGMVAGSAVGFSWSPVQGMQNSNSLTPMVYPEDLTVYTLTALSPFGCDHASDNVTVKVYKTVVPPNIFSPNGDGINDSWIIPGLETYLASKVSVYSRWGQLVFRTKSIDKIWDGLYNGKPIPVGTYYYVIELIAGKPILSGWVLVVR